MDIIIIGTSQIIEHHINCLQKLKFNIIAICSTNIKSKNYLLLKKKYKIKNAFNSIDNLIIFAKNQKKFSFFLAPRIIDSEKILLHCLKFKQKIFIEKPISNNLNFFKKISIYKKLTFVGYNRLFYNNVIYLTNKLRNKKNLFIEVSCAENNKKDILTNSCHIISILLKIFDDFKILDIKKNKNYIFVQSQTKNHDFMLIKFNFKAAENFEIKIIDKNLVYLFKPIERLLIYKGLKKVLINKINYYIPNKIKEIDEFKIDIYKPGFLNQVKLFKKFIKYDKPILNNIKFAEKVSKLCNQIYGKKFF